MMMMNNQIRGGQSIKQIGRCIKDAHRREVDHVDELAHQHWVELKFVVVIVRLLLIVV
jgi:hypothetical protein